MEKTKFLILGLFLSVLFFSGCLEKGDTWIFEDLNGVANPLTSNIDGNDYNFTNANYIFAKYFCLDSNCISHWSDIGGGSTSIIDTNWQTAGMDFKQLSDLNNFFTKISDTNRWINQLTWGSADFNSTYLNTASIDTNWQTSMSDFNSVYDGRYTKLSDFNSLGDLRWITSGQAQNIFMFSFDGNFYSKFKSVFDSNFGAKNLTDLNNVNISVPTTNQILQYDGNSWKNATISTGGTTDTTLDTNTIANLQWLNTQHLFTARVDMNSDLNMVGSSIINIKDMNFILGTKQYLDGNLYKHTTGLNNDFEGRNSGKDIVSGYDNFCRGTDSCANLISGYRNTVTGVRALYYGENVVGNTLYGTEAGRDLNNGAGANSIFGDLTGRVLNFPSQSNALYGDAIMKDSNIAIDMTVSGSTALLNCPDCRHGVAIGKGAFSLLSVPSVRFIVIGPDINPPAYNTDVNDSLWIDVEQTATPLIYGDFARNELTIWGDLRHPDDFKQYFGTAKDVSHTYSSGTGNLTTKLDEVGVSNWDIDSTDDGVNTWYLNGARVWDSIGIGIESMRAIDEVPAPTFPLYFQNDGQIPASMGVSQALFPWIQDAHMNFTLEFGNEYDEGSDFIPFIDWGLINGSPVCNVVWELEMTCAPAGAPFPNTTVSQIVSAGAPYPIHTRDYFAIWSGANETISTVCVGRIGRLATDPRDTCGVIHNQQVWGHYFGIDMIEDTWTGSATQLVK